MSDQEPLEEVRQRLIELLDGEEDEAEGWRITLTALTDARKILSTYRGHFGAYAINAFIADKLRSRIPMHTVTLGSAKTGFVMNDVDEQGLYIKLAIESEFDGDIAVIMSFHVSEHFRG